MLVAAGQPYEVNRTVRDAAGAPTQTPTPTVVAWRPADGLLGGGTLLLQATSEAHTCTVRSVETGVWAARLPGALLSDLGEVVVEWTWEWDGDTYTARDELSVTTVPVCSLDDLASLPGETARVIGVAGRLRAISAATEQIEGATRETYSPRIGTVDLYPGQPIPFPSPTLIRAAVQNGAPLHVEDVRLDTMTGDFYLPAASQSDPITLVVVYGMPRPLQAATRAVALLATAAMADGPFDDRGVAVDTEGGMVRMLTAGVSRAMFSIPEVEAFVRRRRIPGMASA